MTEAAIQIEELAKIIADAQNKRQPSGHENSTLRFPRLESLSIQPAEKRIGLPEGMTEAKGSKILAQAAEALEQEIQRVRQFSAREEDLYVAVHEVCLQMFAHTGKGNKISGGFFSPDMPPRIRDVVVGLDRHGNKKVKTVAVSGFQLENLEATIDFGNWYHEEYGYCGMIAVSTKKRHEREIDVFLDAVEEYINRHSIYKGEVVEFKKRKHPREEETRYELTHMRTDPDRNIVYTKDVETDLNFALFGKIKHSQTFKSIGQDSTFRTLLYGPFGTGKTECAQMAAEVAVANGWTAVFFTPGSDDTLDDFEAAINVASMYGPSLLIVEDVDKFYGRDLNENQKSHVSNFIQGAMAKTSEVSLLMTTNHLESFDARMTRRLTPVKVDVLDREATERLFNQLLGKELADDVDFDRIYEVVSGSNPSFIRGTFDDARKNSVVTNNGEVGHKLTTDDLLSAAKKNKDHYDIHMSQLSKPLAERYIDAMREAEQLKAQLFN